MIAVAAIARQWRAALLGLLLLFVALVILLTLQDEQAPFDRLPLSGVPETDYARRGIELVPAYGEEAGMNRLGAEFLAKEFVGRFARLC